MRSARIVWVLLAAGNMSGCLFSSLDADIRTTWLQVERLEQRVARLESPGSAGGTAAVSSDAFAEGPMAEDEPRTSGIVWRQACGKLARGATNTVTGWVEIPKRIQETSLSSGAFAGWTWGLLRGLGYGFVRTVGGVYEVVTFPFPAPRDYRPVMRPDYVFTS